MSGRTKDNTFKRMRMKKNRNFVSLSCSHSVIDMRKRKINANNIQLHVKKDHYITIQIRQRKTNVLKLFSMKIESTRKD
jgi:hypothetical protein